MKLLTFKGGIHPKYNKELANDKALEKAEPPKVVYIPLQQHIGAPASAVVEIGQEVKLGQLIGKAQGFVSANIHSSVSGKVIAIEERDIPGGRGLCISIENDFRDEVDENIKPYGDLETLDSEQIKKIVSDSGIVGLGGATFPTHVKLAIPQDAKAEAVILNGAECEPYLTADHRLMLEQPEEVVFGLLAMMKAINVNKGFIGIEINKPDAIEKVQEAASKYPQIEVVALEVKYPQGAEKQLIYACLGKEVPSGALPISVGAVVSNVGTAAQLSKSIKTGMPLVERITTITGRAIKNPKNLITRVGTPVSEIIEQCGGFVDEGKVGKVILGGPMMGNTQYTIDVVTNKGTSGILCLPDEESHIEEPTNCIRCGRCVEGCPMNLRPLYISAYALKNDFEGANNYRPMDCIECGCCTYICPANRPLLQSIRLAKNEIRARQKR
ncbi:MAG: electron transport complex subunit RsxC [Clostridioides sp.]|jgi:electron transport complex protein RnfC|nr:electron transport complex subunit RsxC [Clostridioides sp.]